MTTTRGRTFAQALLCLGALPGSLFPAHARAEPPEPHFTISDLGPLPHISDDIAPGLGVDGSISAWAATPSGGFVGTYRRSPASPPVMIGQPAANCFASDAAPGVVVGLAKDPSDLRLSKAFLWKSGKVTLLPTLGGANASACAVNAAGEVAGIADRKNGLHHACVWRGGKAGDLGTLPGGDYSAATGLNASGEVVGVSNGAANGRSRAVVWHKGHITPLGLLPDGSVSAARAVNMRGDAAGWADSYGGVIHAVVWRRSVPTDMGSLGDDPSAAWSLNDAGQVVGAAAVSAGKLHAFLWQRGRMTDLNTLIPAHSGWLLQTAYRISRQGWILGVGRHGSEARLFLLRPLASVNQTSTQKAVFHAH